MITIRNHELKRTGMEGNGFHGICAHCGLDCTTDLGWSSWSGVECIERPVTKVSDMIPEVKHYIRYRGYRLGADLIFRRAYDNIEYTIEQMYEYVATIGGDLMVALRGKDKDWITLEEYQNRRKILIDLGYNHVSYNPAKNKNLVQYTFYN